MVYNSFRLPRSLFDGNNLIQLKNFKYENYINWAKPKINLFHFKNLTKIAIQ